MRILKKRDVIAILSCVVLTSCGAPATDATNAPAAPQVQAATESAAAKPANVGDCVDTTVAWVGNRLENAPESGSAIQYSNGMTQTSYEAVPGIDHSRVGDGARLCLVSIPENCPPNDDRGRVYSAVNARTHETWSEPDSEHMCGGA